MGMFDDFFSSSKGPGVMGLILGVIVLGGFGALGLAVFDGRLDGSTGSDSATEVASQASAIEGLKGSLEDLKKQRVAADERAKLVEELESLQRKLNLHQDAVTGLEEDLKAAQDGITQEENDWEKYKAAYRKFERTSAQGEEIERLELQDGAVLTEVVVRDVNDLGMQVRTRNGSRTISWKELPDDLIDRFQFTEELTAVAVAKVEKREIIADIDQGRQGMLDQIRALTAEIARKNDEIKQLRRDLTIMNGSIATLLAGAIRDEEKAHAIRARGGKNQLKTLDASVRNKRDRAGKLEGQVSQKQSAISRLQGEISRNEAKITNLRRQVEQSK